MQPTGMTRVAAIAFSSMVFVASCRRAKDATGDIMAESAEIHAQPTNNLFVADFQRLVVSSNMTVAATESEVNKLCWKISDLPDRKEAVRLYDQFIEMAIAQEVTQLNLYHRQNWYSKLWFIAMSAFSFAQDMRDDTFEAWSRMLRFFGKYVDEIVAVEKSLPATDWTHWRMSDVRKGEYLMGLKGDFKTSVHVMKDLHFAKLSKGLTVEQKADVYRRLDELNKYTITPTNFPGGKR